VALTLEVGLKWNIIAERMEMSDPVKIKNRYYNTIKRKGKLDIILSKLESE